MTWEDMGRLVISVEHGWLCVRTSEQWLLWSKKLDEIPPMGFTLESIRAEMEEALALHQKAQGAGR